MKKMLVNYKSEINLVENFDKASKVNGLNRTQTLNWLMKKYIQDQAQKVRSNRNTNKIPVSLDNRETFLNYDEPYW